MPGNMCDPELGNSLFPSAHWKPFCNGKFNEQKTLWSQSCFPVSEAEWYLLQQPDPWHSPCLPFAPHAQTQGASLCSGCTAWPHGCWEQWCLCQSNVVGLQIMLLAFVFQGLVALGVPGGIQLFGVLVLAGEWRGSSSSLLFPLI